MPKVENFGLVFSNRYLDAFSDWNGNFYGNLMFKLESETLKDICIMPSNCFSDINVECPLLEKWNGDDVTVYSDSS